MNKYLKAALGLVFFSVFLHLFILLVFAFIRQDIGLWNYFNILEIDFIFPNVASGWFYNTLSGIAAAAVYLLCLLIITIRSRKNKVKNNTKNF
jgi:hypothetical protein